MPLIWDSVARASSVSPRDRREMGVSGMAREPSAMTDPGTAPSASPTRQPHPPMNLDVQ